jgi:hypothetical protein
MTNYARILDNVAVDISTDPQAQFHVLVAAQFVEVPDAVEAGWIVTGVTWAAPAAPPVIAPVQQYLLTPSRPQFLLMFTSAERVAIRASTDPVIKDFLAIVADPALEWIDLSLASLQEGLAYLVASGLLTSDRLAVIEKGWPL